MEGKAVLDFGSSWGGTPTMGWGEDAITRWSFGVTEPPEAGTCSWGVGQKGSGWQHHAVFRLPVSGTGWRGRTIQAFLGRTWVLLQPGEYPYPLAAVTPVRSGTSSA